MQVVCAYDNDEIPRLPYEYDSKGRAAFVKDATDGSTIRTGYDQTDRPNETEQRDGEGNLKYRTLIEYDKKNRVKAFNEATADQNYKTEYTYDADNRVTKVRYNSSDTSKVDYVYDKLNRITSRTVTNGASSYATQYTYASGATAYGENATTPLVSSITQGEGENAMNFAYTYDSRGNITSETRNGLTTTYVYDALGQLVRVNDPHENATWIYTYDRGGNILNKARYAYTTVDELGEAIESIPYTYGDGNWKDKLTAYNGVPITYDAIGNPLNDGTWTYEWQAGRQLKRMSTEGKVVSFKYDHNGLRTQKVVEADWGPETTNYYLHGKLLTHMTVDYRDTSEVVHQDVLHFFYDAQSRPEKVHYNGILYTYIHNLQGDIVGMLDNSGTLVVEYKYDPWGKGISISGSLATTLGKRNPFRYRGYIYDEETGLYYLRSRYYSAGTCRFILPDVICKGNLYTYCYGKPLEHVDSSGYMPVKFLNVFSGAYNLGMIDASSASSAVIVLNGGNVYNGFHEIAQLNVAKKLYSMGYAPILEYRVAGVGEADIVAGAFVWEVKPIGTTTIDQPGKYTSENGLTTGFDIDEITGIPIISDIKMRITSSGGGVLHYSFYNDRGDVRSSEVKSIISGRLFWAALVFGIILGGTLLEDVLSGGAGVADDIPSLGAAGSVAALILG